MARTCTRPQAFQRPELKLFDGALGPANLFCDLANTFFLYETFEDDGPLVGRKIIDQPEQNDAAFDVRPMRRIEVVGSLIDRFS